MIEQTLSTRLSEMIELDVQELSRYLKYVDRTYPNNI